MPSGLQYSRSAGTAFGIGFIEQRKVIEKIRAHLGRWPSWSLKASRWRERELFTSGPTPDLLALGADFRRVAI